MNRPDRVGFYWVVTTHRDKKNSPALIYYYTQSIYHRKSREYLRTQEMVKWFNGGQHIYDFEKCKDWQWEAIAESTL